TGDAHPAAGDLLEDQSEGDRVEIQPAVLFGDRDPEEAHVRHALDDFRRVAAALLPLPRYGDDFAVDKGAQRRSEFALLFSELKVPVVPLVVGTYGCASITGRERRGVAPGRRRDRASRPGPDRRSATPRDRDPRAG